MRQAFDALGPDDQRVLIAMLDAGRSSVSIADLAAAYHRSGATRDLGERLGVLGGHFLRPMNVDETVEWMHPSWRDLIIERLSADVLRRREFLSCCGVDGLLLALSTRGGTSGDRRFPLLKDPEDWETLVGRLPNLVKESNTADTRRLLSAVAELSRRNPGALVTRLVRLALEEIRARWHSRGEALDPYSLELYYGTSERLTPLLPGPDLRATWEAVDPIGELEAADPHDFLGQHLADRISRWLRTAQVIQANEPRFFRQVEFPANSAIAVDKYIALVTYDLQSEYLTSGIDEHEVAALEMRAFEKAPAQAAALFPDHRGDLQRLAEAAGEKAVGFELAVERLADEAEERRREIEDWEHIDYDESEDAPTQHEAFSLAALMSDL